MTSTTKWELDKLKDKFIKEVCSVIPYPKSLVRGKLDEILKAQSKELERQSIMKQAATLATCEQQETVLKAELVSKIEGMRKDESVVKQAKIAMSKEWRDKYSLIQIRMLVKGWNKALDKVKALVEEK